MAIDKEVALSNIKLITEEENEALINLYINRSEEFILNYCNQSDVPKELQGTLEDLAIIKLSMSQKEHLKTEVLGSYNSSFIEGIPAPMLSQLNRFRLMRVR